MSPLPNPLDPRRRFSRPAVPPAAPGAGLADCGLSPAGAPMGYNAWMACGIPSIRFSGVGSVLTDSGWPAGLASARICINPTIARGSCPETAMALTPSLSDGVHRDARTPG